MIHLNPPLPRELPYEWPVCTATAYDEEGRTAVDDQGGSRIKQRSTRDVSGPQIARNYEDGKAPKSILISYKFPSRMRKKEFPDYSAVMNP
jgi:hypothetical protein